MSSIPANIANNLVLDHETALIVRIDFNGVTVGLTESSYDISYNGVNYLANGLLLGVSDYKETADVKVNDITLILSSVDQTISAIILQNNQIGREVFVDRVIYNPTDPNSIMYVEEVAVGEVTSFSNGSTSDGSVMSITVSSLFADWQRKAGRTTTNSSQQLQYPDDLGMEYSNNVKDDLKWGGK